MRVSIKSTLATRPILLAVLIFVFVALPLGHIEGLYGRVDYTTDAISYLDVARAIHDGQWQMAFNPLWSIGYPLLIAAMEPFFPSTGDGEWRLLHLLNLFVFATAYASFIFFLRGLVSAYQCASQKVVTAVVQNRLIVAGTALFLCSELCIDNVSRVGPDMLVTTFFLLALGLLSRLLDEPRTRTFILLGCALGAGYIIKAIFLPLSLTIITVAGIALHRRRLPILKLTLVVAFAALFAVPYIAGLSHAYGHFTMGESGTVNYAWHVNRVTQIHWQGGPARFGKPVHPTTQVSTDPPIYSFAEPFHVSYPPFFNPPYFYEGLKHVFILKLQLRAIAANLLHLEQVLRPLPIFYAVLICCGLILSYKPARTSWFATCKPFWPLLLPAFIGIALYLQVHLEGRYLPGFLLVIIFTPFALLLLAMDQFPSRITQGILAFLLVGCAATLLITDRSTLARALHRTHYSDSGQWVLARFMQQHGLHPGDEVAVIGGPAASCTWAHVDHLRIVSELEVDLYAPPDTAINLFWNATPDRQKTILGVFAKSGAKLVISRVTASQHPTDGWIRVPGTDNVVHDLH